jgi:hypothetical protein
MLCRVALVRTDVSEELSASSIRVTRIGELGTTLAVTSNWCTLQRNTRSPHWYQSKLEWMCISINIDLGTRWRLSVSRPGRFTPGKESEQYSWDGTSGGPLGRSGRYEGEQDLAPAGNWALSFQTVAPSYTDWAIVTHNVHQYAYHCFCAFYTVLQRCRHGACC